MSIKDRGFASMRKTTQRAIASKGGKAAHAKGSAYEWTSEQARAAGKKGGKVSGAKRSLAADQRRRELQTTD